MAGFTCPWCSSALRILGEQIELMLNIRGHFRSTREMVSQCTGGDHPKPPPYACCPSPHSPSSMGAIDMSLWASLLGMGDRRAI